MHCYISYPLSGRCIWIGYGFRHRTPNVESYILGLAAVAIRTCPSNRDLRRNRTGGAVGIWGRARYPHVHSIAYVRTFTANDSLLTHYLRLPLCSSHLPIYLLYILPAILIFIVLPFNLPQPSCSHDR